MEEITLDAGKVKLKGNLEIPKDATHIVIFVHGSGSSRFSPRNNAVANTLNEAGLATLLFDLLNSEEEKIDEITREFRFDIERLTDRLIEVTRFLQKFSQTRGMKMSYFGASTGAAAAIKAAVALKNQVTSVVSRGGRPDLAGGDLAKLNCPILLIVGGDDLPVIELNEKALVQIPCEKQLEIIEAATHLFSEPGALEQVAHLAQRWFLR